MFNVMKLGFRCFSDNKAQRQFAFAFGFCLFVWKQKKILFYLLLVIFLLIISNVHPSVVYFLEKPVAELPIGI